MSGDMDDLRKRLKRTDVELKEMSLRAHDAGNIDEYRRLNEKRRGVLIALDYTRAYP